MQRDHRVPAREAGEETARPFFEPALRAIAWTRHLDVNGCGLLESPEASDWADMMPHRHNVLYANVLYAVTLRAGARLHRLRGESAPAARLAALASDVRRKINLAFWLPDCSDVANVGRWLVELAKSRGVRDHVHVMSAGQSERFEARDRDKP